MSEMLKKTYCNCNGRMWINWGNSFWRFSPDGKRLVSGSVNGELKISDADCGEPRGEHNLAGLVLDCRFDPVGSRLAVAVGGWGEDRPGIHFIP
jgi:WD40 repeat protein